MQLNSENSQAVLIDTVQLHKVVDFMLKNNISFLRAHDRYDAKKIAGVAEENIYDHSYEESYDSSDC